MSEAAFTIDASVWISAESPGESAHGASRNFLDAVAMSRRVVVVPTLLAVEMAAVAARTRADSELGRSTVNALLAIRFLRWIDLDDSQAREAAELATRCRLRGADAVYAAVARTHGCTLVSLDNEHLTRLASVIPAVTPSDALAILASP